MQHCYCIVSIAPVYIHIIIIANVDQHSKFAMTVPFDLLVLFMSEIIPQRLGSMHQQSAISKDESFCYREVPMCVCHGEVDDKSWRWVTPTQLLY